MSRAWRQAFNTDADTRQATLREWADPDGTADTEASADTDTSADPDEASERA